MSQSRVKYHDVSTVPYGEIFLWACSATGLLAPTSREAPKQEGKGAFRGLRARRRPTSSWLCQHVLELWSFNFRARLRCLFGCTWKDIDNAFVQYYYLRGVLTCPKYLWNTVKHCTFSLVFFNFFFETLFIFQRFIWPAGFGAIFYPGSSPCSSRCWESRTSGFDFSSKYLLCI